MIKDIKSQVGIFVKSIHVCEDDLQKVEAKLLIGPYAGQTVITQYCTYHNINSSSMYYPDHCGVIYQGDFYDDNRTGFHCVSPGENTEFINLHTPWDGEGNRIIVGQKVYYAKANNVHRGIVKAIGKPVYCGYFWTRKLNITDEKTGQHFTLNHSTRCLNVV